MSYRYRPAPVVAEPTRNEVQGWILNGYNMATVRHLVMAINHPLPVKNFLGAAAAAEPGVTPIRAASRWQLKPERTLNVGITWSGLKALGVPRTTLDGFPTDYKVGPAGRAARLGDIFASDPKNWDGDMADPNRVHLLFTIHGQDTRALDEGQTELFDALGSAVELVQTYDGAQMEHGRVHFGYVDGIAQPRIAGFEKSPPVNDAQQPAPLGAFFAGHPCEYEEIIYDMPEPVEFAGNATYNAFRVLEQDVFGYEDYLAEQSVISGKSAEWLAARICGRWRNGDPVELYPDEPRNEGFDGQSDVVAGSRRNDFTYSDNHGQRCPLGSHIRRSNPRNTPIVQKSTSSTRRIIRRGMPYGPPIVPGQQRDEIKRGLVGNFFCASLTAQFEGVMQDWINLGLHHPDTTGTNDVILGANDPKVSEFRIPMADGPDITMRNFPTFITTQASAYTLMPTLSGLRWLAKC